jgi:hypothetical protein
MMMACGRAPDMNPEFSKYYWEFEHQAYVHGRLTKWVRSIQFGPTNPGVAAFCRRPGRMIVVNKKSWKKLSDYKKYVLMYHELGHCALKQGHRGGIMASNALTTVTWNVWNNERDELFSELFNE